MAREGIGFGAHFPGVERDDHVELGKVFRAMCLPRGEDLGCREVLQVLMVGDNIDRCASSFEVVLPMFEGIVDGHECFVVNIVVGLGVFKHPGVERNRVVVTIWGSDRQHCG